MDTQSIGGAPSGHTLFHVDDEIGWVFYWLSTGLAVLTALLQGLVTALALMTESADFWTFRFRIARIEHYWWSTVSALLLTSLVMVILSFVSGNGGDSISVLALSSATFLAIVQYMLPAWYQRHYIKTRWYAWTNPSRTSIKKKHEPLCGDQKAWQKTIQANKSELLKLQSTPSDYYGWKFWPSQEISYDPADILSVVTYIPADLADSEKGRVPHGVYFNHDPSPSNVSLLWGPHIGFRRGISRAVSSMPLNLLKSIPMTTDGYNGQGLTNAMGILGRNKGLQPWKLIFKLDAPTCSYMESSSTWTPRPAKVLRSFYKQTMNTQYSGLGEQYVHAAVELALIMADMPHWAVQRWLKATMEHQSLELNHSLATEILTGFSEEDRNTALAAHYESSYVSMIISLNYMPPLMRHRREARSMTLCRPDLLCTGILLKAWGHAEPMWWNSPVVCKRREDEVRHLSQDSDWRLPMAKLLGLDHWPPGFHDNVSTW